MENKIFDKPKDVFEEQLNGLFSRSDPQSTDLIIRVISLLFYGNSFNKDLINLYNLVGLDTFLGVCTLFDHRKVEFPSKDELHEIITTAVLYYYRDVCGMSWPEIKDHVSFEFSPISYSVKLKKFDKFLLEKVQALMVENQ